MLGQSVTEYDATNEGSDRESSLCYECGQENRALEIEGEGYCRDCGYTILYKMPQPEWENIHKIEDADDDTRIPDIDSEDLFHPPYPGTLKYSYFTRITIDESRGTPQYEANLTRVVRVAPISAGEEVQVYATEGSHGFPVIDLYYLDKNEEVDELPNARRILDYQPGAAVNLPRTEVEKLFHKYLEIPLSEYDGTNNLMLWPQAMPDRIRLYALCFESEWEQMREEVTGTEASATVDNSDEMSPDNDTESDSEEPVTAISSDTLAEVIEERNVERDAVVAALEEFAASIDREQLETAATSEPLTYQDQVVYTVSTSTWNEDELTIDLPDDLREAIRWAHNQEAKVINEAADSDLARRLIAHDAIVLETE